MKLDKESVLQNENIKSDYKRIYVVGPCIVEGILNPEQETLCYLIDMYLSNYIKCKRYKVIPVGVPNNRMEQILKLYEYDICKNDIVLFMDELLGDLSEEDLDLTSRFNAYTGEDCLYYENRPIHTTVYGNEWIVEEIVNRILLPVIRNQRENEGRGEIYHYPEVYLKEEDKDELKKYLDSIPTFENAGGKTIGSIVMNANPFTKGHYHLVETASRLVDLLYVFVVEEDASDFSFKSRMEMVKLGCGGFENVRVIPSGKFIISSTTFQSYFEKGNIQEKEVDTTKDVTMFGKYIAPALHITKRFVGEEPFDKVTLQYNEMMKKRLPAYGVDLIEIPRVKEQDTVVSATLVREFVKKEMWDKLLHFVPLTTYNYIKENRYKSTHAENLWTQKDDFEEIKNWDKLRKWIASQKKFIIYGTGRDAAYIWDNIDEDRDRVYVFCDKKANRDTYQFNGKDVIKPGELNGKYSELPILVSSRIYRREIYLELCRMGIDENRLMLVLA